MRQYLPYSVRWCFFINPGAIILHRQIFLELMLPAAYGGFFDYRFVGPDGFFRQPETCRYFDGGVVACCGCFIAVFTATCRIFRRRLLAGVAAVLRLADLARPQHRQLRPLNAARRIHRFSDGLCRQRRFELNCARKCI